MTFNAVPPSCTKARCSEYVQRKVFEKYAAEQMEGTGIFEETEQGNDGIKNAPDADAFAPQHREHDGESNIPLLDVFDFLVEAGRVELPSEKGPHKASTGVVCV